MSVHKMVELLDCSYEARSQIVPCLVGPVGIGKTVAVEMHRDNMAKKYGKDISVTTIIASQILPNEVSGITMPDLSTHSMEIYDHFRLSHMKDGDILFFDELLEADQLVLSACLTLIESRMMMSGKKLPDIQIVAATNPTISPASIKPSIRQRFMFSIFEFDQEAKEEYKEYARQRFNVDIPSITLESICDNNTQHYNFLSPRSLTKLLCWMDSAKSEEELENITEVVQDMWGFALANDLQDLFVRKFEVDKEDQVKEALMNEFPYLKASEFENTTISEMVDLIRKLGDWSKAAEFLASHELE